MKNKSHGLKVPGSFLLSAILATAIVVPALAAPSGLPTTSNTSPNFSDLTLGGTLTFGSGPTLAADGNGGVSLTGPLEAASFVLTNGSLAFGTSSSAPTISKDNSGNLTFSSDVNVNGTVTANSLTATNSSSFQDVTAKGLTVNADGLTVSGSAKFGSLSVGSGNSVVNLTQQTGTLGIDNNVNVGKSLTATRIGTTSTTAWSLPAKNVTATCPAGSVVVSCNFKVDSNPGSKVGDVYNDTTTCKADAAPGGVYVQAVCMDPTK